MFAKTSALAVLKEQSFQGSGLASFLQPKHPPYLTTAPPPLTSFAQYAQQNVLENNRSAGETLETNLVGHKTTKTKKNDSQKNATRRDVPHATAPTCAPDPAPEATFAASTTSAPAASAATVATGACAAAFLACPIARIRAGHTAPGQLGAHARSLRATQRQ